MRLLIFLAISLAINVNGRNINRLSRAIGNGEHGNFEHDLAERGLKDIGGSNGASIAVGLHFCPSCYGK